MTFDVTTLVGFHTAVSLVALVAGLVVVVGMLGGRTMPGLTALFLTTAVIASATGFLLPADRVLPSHVVGVVSLLALGTAIVARYRHGYAGRWRITYVLAVVVATYLDAFVAVAQVFLKIPAAHDLAPTQGEPPFAAAQGMLLLAFALLAMLAARRFRPLA